MIRRRHIRSLADRLLQKHAISQPPVDVRALAQALGAEVRMHRADAELSGFLLRDSAKRRTIIGVNTEQHPNRQRFTIAHEIGHLLLHEGRPMYIDSTQQVFRLSLRSKDSSTGEIVAEREANLFAAEVLMPEALIERELATTPEFDVHDEKQVQRLADRFQVSAQALSIQLGHLGYTNA